MKLDVRVTLVLALALLCVAQGQGHLSYLERLLDLAKKESFFAKPADKSQNITCDPSTTSIYRTYDGSCNNLKNPWFGQVGELIRRDSSPRYQDGAGIPLSNVPDARFVSDTIFQTPANVSFFPPGKRAPWSLVFVGVAQFFLHDLIHMAVPNASEPMPIANTIPFYRANIYPGSGTSPQNPRQYTSSTTQWIDLSTVYGVSEDWNKKLRSHTGGQMLTGPNGGLPFNTANLPMEQGFWPLPPSQQQQQQLFMCGDPRCNQDFFLLTMHDVFLREHNRLAQDLAKKNPSWSDEKLFQEARRLNTFIWQNVVLREFTMSFGGEANNSFFRAMENLVESGYLDSLNPQVSVAWELVYRFHVILRDFFARNPEDNSPQQRVDFSMSTMYNASSYLDIGLESLLLGMCQTQASRVGPHMLDDIRNVRLGGKKLVFDLAATSVERSYDYGTGTLNDLRSHYFLPPYMAFEGITQDPQTVAKLKKTFSNVDQVDVYTGALLEDPDLTFSDQMTVGPLIVAMIFRGAMGYSLSDRFFYLHKGLPTSPSQQEMDLINNSTLAQLIMRNTKLQCIQSFPVLYDPQQPLKCFQ